MPKASQIKEYFGVQVFILEFHLKLCPVTLPRSMSNLAFYLQTINMEYIPHPILTGLQMEQNGNTVNRFGSAFLSCIYTT